MAASGFEQAGHLQGADRGKERGSASSPLGTAGSLTYKSKRLRVTTSMHVYHVM